MPNSTLMEDLKQNNVLTIPSFSNFPRIIASLAAGQRTSIGFVGDSTGSEGWGANGAPSGPGVAGDENNARRARSWVAITANLLNNRDLPTRCDAVIGAGATSSNTAVQYMAKVPQVSLGTGWTLSTTVSVGGRLFENSTTTDPWTFTPDFPADGFDIYYVQSTGFATFTVTDGATVLDTVNSAGTLTLIKRTVTRARATTAPISLQRNGTGGTFRLIGVVPFDTTNPMLEFWPMGWAGSQTSNWTSATNAIAPFNGLSAFIPTQWIVELGPNDSNAAVADATFGTNYASLVYKLNTVTTPAVPVSIGIPPASRGGTGSYNIPAGYLTQLDAIKAARTWMTPNFNFRALPFVANDYFDSSVHMDLSGNRKRALEALRMFY